MVLRAKAGPEQPTGGVAALLAELRENLLDWKEQLLPRHPMEQAISYALIQWQELNVLSFDAASAIDNNVSEMNRVALTRKNSFFAGNPRRGKTAAILTSLTSICRRHEVDPQFYLTRLLVNLPTISTSVLPAWLHDQWKLISLISASVLTAAKSTFGSCCAHG